MALTHGAYRWQYMGNIKVIIDRGAANVLALVSIAVILLAPTRYNDLLTTCKNKALEILKGKKLMR